MSEKNSDLNNAKKTLLEIEQWEKKITAPNLLRKAGEIIEKPIDYALKKLMPKKMESVIIKSIEGILYSLIYVSGYTFSDKEVQNRSSKIIKKHQELSSLENIKKTASSYMAENNIVGAIQGFGCGLGGATLIAADIPLIFTITFRVIQQIGTAFGYQMDTIEEKQFIMKILDLGSGVPTVAKVKSMMSKEILKNYVKKVTFKRMEQIAAIKVGQKSAQEIAVELLHVQGKRATKKAVEQMTKSIVEDAAKNGSKAVAITTARKTAKDVGQRLTKKKLLQLIPLAGGIIGAGFNFWFVKNVSEAAYFAYLKRYLYDNYKI